MQKYFFTVFQHELSLCWLIILVKSTQSKLSAQAISLYPVRFSADIVDNNNFFFPFLFYSVFCCCSGCCSFSIFFSSFAFLFVCVFFVYFLQLLLLLLLLLLFLLLLYILIHIRICGQVRDEKMFTLSISGSKITFASPSMKPTLTQGLI